MPCNSQLELKPFYPNLTDPPEWQARGSIASGALEPLIVALCEVGIDVHFIGQPPATQAVAPNATVIVSSAPKVAAVKSSQPTAKRQRKGRGGPDQRPLAGKRRRLLRTVLDDATLAKLKAAGLSGESRIGALARWLESAGMIPEDLYGFGYASSGPLRQAFTDIGYDFPKRRLTPPTRLASEKITDKMLAQV